MSEQKDKLREDIIKRLLFSVNLSRYGAELEADFIIALIEPLIEEAKKQALISVGKEVKRMDKSVYLVPDYKKYREALKEMGIE